MMEENNEPIKKPAHLYRFDGKTEKPIYHLGRRAPNEISKDAIHLAEYEDVSNDKLDNVRKDVLEEFKGTDSDLIQKVQDDFNLSPVEK